MRSTPLGGRHRSAHPIGPPRRSIFKRGSLKFSHITIQAADDDGSDPNTEDKEVDFVLKESLQIEIEDQLLHKTSLASIPESPNRPRTFAEAAMSTRPRSRVGRKISVNNGSEATLSGPMSLGAFGPFKHTLKKRKKASKWSPLDIATADGGSEVGSISGLDEEDGSSRAVSPNLQTTMGLFPSPPHQVRTTLLPFLPVTATPGRGKGNVALIGSGAETDIEPTPTQDRFDSTALIHRDSLSTDSIDESEDDYPSDEVADSGSDTQSIRWRAEAAMAGIQGAFGSGNAPRPGEDAFDSLEWDPNLPSPSAPDASPEVVTVTPQPVAYTTVGSLVNPNAVPQFTAPNRIQREGAGRRPLMPFIQNRSLIQHRHQDSYFHGRDPPPPLSMQNSMLYTQQLSHSPVSFNQSQQPSSARSSRSALSSHQLPPLAEPEKQVLKRLHNAGVPSMLSGNIMGSPSTPTPSSKQYICMADYASMEASTTRGSLSNLTDHSLPNLFSINLDTNRHIFKVNESMEEDDQRRDVQGQLQGLETMQTIQRLSRFDNPVQEIARNRLSEFSVAKSMSKKTVANPTGTSLSLEELIRNDPVPKTGELDFTYQFPTTAVPIVSRAQPNPLFRAYGASAVSAPPSNRSLGVPRPLTAGPPGQRHYLGGISGRANANSIENLWNNSGEVQGQPQDPNVHPQAFANPWLYDLSTTTSQTPAPENTQVESDPTKPFDTIPISVALKYFPYGLPTDMTGKFSPLSNEMMVKMTLVGDAIEPITEEENRAAKAQDLNDWFYGGQRRLEMSAVDHVDDLAQRQLAQASNSNTLGPIGPPYKKSLPLIGNKMITIEEMGCMTTAEAAIPAVDALFGTLLAYAERGPDSRSRLSRFNKSPDWEIDTSDRGNTSFFGEDWGPPPKRTGGDSRYQSLFHNPFSTHWE